MLRPVDVLENRFLVIRLSCRRCLPNLVALRLAGIHHLPTLAVWGGHLAVRLARVQMALAHLTSRLCTLHYAVLVVADLLTPMLVVRLQAQEAQLDVGAALARPLLAHPV